MKKILALCAVVITAVFAAHAYDSASDKVYLNNLKVERVGDDVVGSFTIDASSHLKSNREVVITPYFKGGSEIYKLNTVTVAGRNRYYYHLRNNDGSYVKDVNLFHNTNPIVSAIPYEFSIPYASWMNNCQLMAEVEYKGCANCNEAKLENIAVANLDMVPRVYAEQFVYEAPVTEKVKTRQESGSAFIDFVVGKSVIEPDFRNNPAELAKIKKSIDAVRNDKDLTITKILITGYASPEGPETLNNELSANRAAALLNYVKGLYDFPKSVKFVSEGKGEDWDGLKKWLNNNQIEHKGALLDVINNTALTEDQKDAAIKKDFAKDYAFLLENVYPSLRRSDYVVEYTVREYSNVQEIISVLNTNPRKLSLNEIFIAAETMQPGSDAYNNALLTAVTLYPEDETANINAASVAMNKHDYASAEKYLAKAGNSDVANYSRGVLAAKKGDYQTAKNYFNKAKSVPEARTALEQVEAIIINPVGGVNITNYNPTLTY